VALQKAILMQSETMAEDEPRTGRINYRSDIASFVVDEGGGWDSIELVKEGVVIGNIYENSELLK